MKDRSRSIHDLGLLIVIVIAVAFATVTVYSQNQAANQTPAQGAAPAQSPTATPSPTPTPVNWSSDPLLKPFVFRSIGPASMGGRIDDIAVPEQNPYTIYVAFATNGVWKSTNNGTTFQPIFDTYTTHSIGDIAIAPSDPNIVWVGTGEPNNRQSSSYGDGIYKSVDAGKTFTKMGLEDSQTIARIVIDPKDPNIVYVAVLGHLFGPNRERGIYKTTDGGKTWTNAKFIDEDTGFTDVAMDASDSKTLYAASYQRRRTNFGFNGGGAGSGIWKTVDAGKTWKKLEGGGLPEGVLGRIGLDVSRSNPNVLYAQMEVGTSTGTGGEEPTPGGATPSPSPSPSASPTPGATPAASPTPAPPDPKKSGVWRSDDKGKTWRVLNNENNRPMYYSQIRVDPKDSETVYIGGLNVSKSTDGGKTFRSIQANIAHVDNHAIWINPANSDHLLVGNDGGLNVSYDQGATFEFINTIPAAQFYAIGVDMRKPYYVYGGLQDNGSWGGPSQTRNLQAGITNADWYRVGGGDGFYTLIDPTDHNIIYFESQGGNMQRLDLRTGRSINIRPRGVPRARGTGQRGQGGGGPAPSASPGASPAASPTPDTQTQLAAFAASQGFGGFGGNLQSNIVPTPPATETYRFYWNTPLHLSPHNPRVVYAGGNRLFRSLDRGDTWTATIDLSKQIDRGTLPIMGVPGKDPMASKHDGYSGYGYIVTVAESPKMPGILWVGTDDGNVQVSKDGGSTWTNVSKNVPGIGDGHAYHISRVEPSSYDAATCYLSVDGHRLNDVKPYLFVTKDYGATWTSIVNNLPKWGNVNVVKEDPKNKDLLYVGTEFGLFISLNGGAEWKPFMSGMPTMRIDDILVHPRDNDLIVGTHGRGIFILDDITPLQQLSQKVTDSEAHLFEVRPGTIWQNDVRLARYWGASKLFRGQNPAPGTAISYYLKSPAAGEVKITISDYTGKVVRNLVGTNEPGLNRVQWNLRGDPLQRPQGGGGRGGGGGGRGGGGFAQGLPLEAGTYVVKVSVAGKELPATKVVVENDPGID